MTEEYILFLESLPSGRMYRKSNLLPAITLQPLSICDTYL